MEELGVVTLLEQRELFRSERLLHQFFLARVFIRNLAVPVLVARHDVAYLALTPEFSLQPLDVVPKFVQIQLVEVSVVLQTEVEPVRSQLVLVGVLDCQVVSPHVSLQLGRFEESFDALGWRNDLVRDDGGGLAVEAI